jgi:tRNA(Ile)-lysidine synthase
MARAMTGELKKFIRRHCLIPSQTKILLAVSGGIDSVVLADLLKRADIDFDIAHCNFQLRGEESDGDEDFVRALAHKYEVHFHVIRFDTSAYAKEKSLSTQLAARELRYNWFRELAESHGYSRIATAHHMNDNAETVLLNLIKGAVLSGLQGIKPQNGLIIRPLLWAAREEIGDYAEHNKLPHREDSSNVSVKYLRNNLRHTILPQLREINPSLDETLYQSSRIRQGISDFLHHRIDELKKTFTKRDGIIIPADEIQELNPSVLFLMLELYGFTFSQCEDLYQGLSNTESKQFKTITHEMTKERNRIVIRPLKDDPVITEVLVEDGIERINFTDQFFEIEKVDYNEAALSHNASVAQFDFEKLKFPLKIRQWLPGDSFVPLGMHGRKKISDFLTDIHAEALSKANQLVLLSGDDIVWLVGKRIDDRYKISPETKQVWKIRLLE